MTLKQNIKAVLESNFAGFREDIIDNAVDIILRLVKTDSIQNLYEPEDRCIYYNTELKYPRCYAQKCAPYTRCQGCKQKCEV